MKLTGRQSNNIEDRSMDTSIYAPHRNPALNKSINDARNAEANARLNQDAQNAKEWGKKNPAYDTLQSMDKWKAPPPMKDASIPIPTPRPDPSDPKPTIFTDPYNKKG